jgi:phosphoribosylformimino-5-aminoimidazole carboxamide ribotide isomerase
VEVIPSIDLRAGRLVRLEQGDYDRETVYDADPASVARRLCAQGAERIHVVDLDAARAGGAANDAAVKEILDASGDVPVQVGGGVRTLERVETLLERGADRVIMGTAALEDPDLLVSASQQHPSRIILGLDARSGRVAVRGWLETSTLTCAELLERFANLPLAAILHTDIERDGMMSGPNLSATVELAHSTKIPVLASGGVSCVGDLVELARTGVIAGAVVGRALYNGALSLEDALREVAAS